MNNNRITNIVFSIGLAVAMWQAMSAKLDAALLQVQLDAANDRFYREADRVDRIERDVESRAELLTGPVTYGGIGVLIESVPPAPMFGFGSPGGITIVDVRPGTPAARAGLLANDRIIDIDRDARADASPQQRVERLESTDGMGVEWASARLRGAEGSEVTLVITRGPNVLRWMTITRERVASQ